MSKAQEKDEGATAEEEYKSEMKKKDAEKVKDAEDKQAPKIDVNSDFINKIQSKLNSSNVASLETVGKQSKDAASKVMGIKGFEEYFRPFQEARTLLWNELGKANSYDLPINMNAGKPDIPADYKKTIKLHFNSASKEQMQYIERLRGRSQDLDRTERMSNTLSTEQIEKKGLKIPHNFMTISAEAAEKKDELLVARIIIFCGVDKSTAQDIAAIADSRSLDDILDSWEYRIRTGYPNSTQSTEPSQSTSQSGYQ